LKWGLGIGDWGFGVLGCGGKPNTTKPKKKPKKQKTNKKKNNIKNK